MHVVNEQDRTPLSLVEQFDIDPAKIRLQESSVWTERFNISSFPFLFATDSRLSPTFTQFGSRQFLPGLENDRRIVGAGGTELTNDFGRSVYTYGIPNIHTLRAIHALRAIVPDIEALKPEDFKAIEKFNVHSYEHDKDSKVEYVRKERIELQRGLEGFYQGLFDLLNNTDVAVILSEHPNFKDSILSYQHTVALVYDLTTCAHYDENSTSEVDTFRIALSDKAQECFEKLKVDVPSVIPGRDRIEAVRNLFLQLGLNDVLHEITQFAMLIHYACVSEVEEANHYGSLPNIDVDRTSFFCEFQGLMHPKWSQDMEHLCFAHQHGENREHAAVQLDEEQYFGLLYSADIQVLRDPHTLAFAPFISEEGIRFIVTAEIQNLGDSTGIQVEKIMSALLTEQRLTTGDRQDVLRPERGADRMDVRERKVYLKVLQQLTSASDRLMGFQFSPNLDPERTAVLIQGLGLEEGVTQYLLEKLEQVEYETADFTVPAEVGVIAFSGQVASGKSIFLKSFAISLEGAFAGRKPGFVNAKLSWCDGVFHNFDVKQEPGKASTAQAQLANFLEFLEQGTAFSIGVFDELLNAVSYAYQAAFIVAACEIIKERNLKALICTHNPFLGDYFDGGEAALKIIQKHLGAMQAELAGQKLAQAIVPQHHFREHKMYSGGQYDSDIIVRARELEYPREFISKFEKYIAFFHLGT